MLNIKCSRVSYLALSHWGGEHLLNADPLTLVVRHSDETGFPTMAYAYNSSFWHTVRAQRDSFFAMQLDTVPDWSQTLQLMAQRGLLAPVHLLPTFSRVLHAGARSTLGNPSHSARRRAPWLRTPYDLRHSIYTSMRPSGNLVVNFTVKPHFRNVFGAVCELRSVPDDPRLEACETPIQVAGLLRERWPVSARYDVVCVPDGTSCPLDTGILAP